MLVPSLKHCCGIVWNPAVRSVTDWKNDARSFSPNGSVPKVFGLLYSRIRVSSAPLIIRKTVAVGIAGSHHAVKVLPQIGGEGKSTDEMAESYAASRVRPKHHAG